jgi:transcriptional regulator with XRE-family HTH domain
MPKSSSILTREDRRRFVSWFQVQAIQKGVAPQSITRHIGIKSLRLGRKAAILKKLGYTSTQQLDRYINGDAEPTAETLRNLCRAFELPWLTAALLIGYIEDLFMALQALYELGLRWCQEDKMEYTPRSGVYLISPKARHIPKRYVQIERYDWTLSKVSPTVNDAYAIPNPTAIAILIATTYFSHGRGGSTKPDYWLDLIRQCSATIDLAMAHYSERLGRKPLNPILKDTTSVLKNERIRRRAPWIAAEYISAWSEEVSRPFFRYTEFALFQREPKDAPPPLSQLRPIPTPEELARV